jgi:hypothetical protein
MNSLSSCTPHGNPFIFNSTSNNNNNTIPPTIIPVCQCDIGWQSHGNDFFDTRITTITNIKYNTACNVNDLAINILWGLVLIMLTWRQTFTYLGFRVQCKKHSGSIRKIQKRKGNLLLLLWMFGHQTFRVCLVDLLIANPLTFLVAVLKLSQKVILGTDVISTIAFAICVPISLFAYASFQVFQFSIVTTKQQHQELRTLHGRLMFASPILFTLLSSIPAIVMLFVDHSLTPYDNYSGIILSIRVAGVFLWQFVTTASLYFLSRESSNVLELFAKTPVMSEGRKRVMSGNGGGGGGGGRGYTSNNSKDDDDSLSVAATNKNIATEAVKQLKNQARVVAFRTVMVMIISIPFTIPYLWAYYCYIVPVAVCLVCSTSPGIEMWYIHRAAKAAFETTSIMRTSLALGGVLVANNNNNNNNNNNGNNENNTNGGGGGGVGGIIIGEVPRSQAENRSR